jgi:hypothetical protein
LGDDIDEQSKTLQQSRGDNPIANIQKSVRRNILVISIVTTNHYYAISFSTNFYHPLFLVVVSVQLLDQTHFPFVTLYFEKSVFLSTDDQGMDKKYIR